MKNLIVYSALVFFLSACEDKDQNTTPDPDSRIVAPKAEFSYIIGENGVLTLQFPVNYQDHYAIDTGNGNMIKEVFTSNQVPIGYLMSKPLRFAENGNYDITLTVANIKGVASTTQTVSIANIPPPPVAGFTYKVLPGGKVSLTNQGKNYQKTEWVHFLKGFQYGGYRHTGDNPNVIFENDGWQYIQQTVWNKYNRGDTKVDSVYISNSKNTGNPVFEGVFFDQIGKLTGSNVNTMRESWGYGGLSNYAVNSVLLKDKGNIMITLGLPQDMSLEGKYNFYKRTFDAGAFGRVFVTRNKPLWSYGEETILLRDVPKALMEIIEVEEVDQPQLFPGLYHKAFWVTFRIKADLGAKGKIDGKLKVRYLVY